MAEGSRICPQCGGLNGIDEKTCYRCGKNLPGPLTSSAQGFFTDFSADGVPATKLIALICLVVYALCVMGDGGFKFDLSLGGAFRTSTLLRYGVLYSDLAYSEPWRLLASVFIHLGVLHIGLNLMSLVSLGRSLEPHFGSARFVLLYTLTGILGFLASQWWYGERTFTAGASGAIFGLVGAFVGVLFARKNPNWKRALANNLIYAGILGFVLPANTAAHLGGFVAGALLGALLEREPKPRARDGVMLALAALCMLGSVASIVLSAWSPVWKEARRFEEAARQRSNFE
jgi:membrane associated rhomboid family serine protease